MSGVGRPSRRDLLVGVTAGIVAGAAGAGIGAAVAGGNDGQQRGPDGAERAEPQSVDAHGATQAGINRPERPQQHAIFSIYTLEDDAAAAQNWLAGLGTRIAALTAGADSSVLPDGPARLTVTVGLGPRIISAIKPSWHGGTALPQFKGDATLPREALTGDVMLQVCADDPAAVALATADLASRIPGRPTWRQRGFRSHGTGTVVRSPLQFRDGIQIPHGTAELRKNVFLQSPQAGASIVVLRKFRLRVADFAALPLREQERAVGRRRRDGVPLSGGTQASEVALGAKDAAGDYVIPVDAHVRRAHPSYTDSHLMFRRSYTYDDSERADGSDTGLIFVAYQRALRTFVETQRRLDEQDRMLEFASPEASFTFLVLPGFTAATPMGNSLQH